MQAIKKKPERAKTKRDIRKGKKKWGKGRKKRKKNDNKPPVCPPTRNQLPTPPTKPGQPQLREMCYICVFVMRPSPQCQAEFSGKRGQKKKKKRKEKGKGRTRGSGNRRPQIAGNHQPHAQIPPLLPCPRPTQEASPTALHSQPPQDYPPVKHHHQQSHHQPQGQQRRRRRQHRRAGARHCRQTPRARHRFGA